MSATTFFTSSVDGQFLAVHDPALHLAPGKIGELLLRARIEAEPVQVKQRVIDGQFRLIGVIFQRFHRLGADAALGKIDDADGRLAVERIVDDRR